MKHVTMETKIQTLVDVTQHVLEQCKDGPAQEEALPQRQFVPTEPQLNQPYG